MILVYTMREGDCRREEDYTCVDSRCRTIKSGARGYRRQGEEISESGQS